MATSYNVAAGEAASQRAQAKIAQGVIDLDTVQPSFKPARVRKTAADTLCNMGGAPRSMLLSVFQNLLLYRDELSAIDGIVNVSTEFGLNNFDLPKSLLIWSSLNNAVTNENLVSASADLGHCKTIASAEGSNHFGMAMKAALHGLGLSGVLFSRNGEYFSISVPSLERTMEYITDYRTQLVARLEREGKRPPSDEDETTSLFYKKFTFERQSDGTYVFIQPSKAPANQSMSQFVAETEYNKDLFEHIFSSTNQGMFNWAEIGKLFDLFPVDKPNGLGIFLSQTRESVFLTTCEPEVDSGLKDILLESPPVSLLEVVRKGFRAGPALTIKKMQLVLNGKPVTIGAPPDADFVWEKLYAVDVDDIYGQPIDLKVVLEARHNSRADGGIVFHLGSSVMNAFEPYIHPSLNAIHIETKPARSGFDHIFDTLKKPDGGLRLKFIPAEHRDVFITDVLGKCEAFSKSKLASTGEAKKLLQHVAGLEDILVNVHLKDPSLCKVNKDGASQEGPLSRAVLNAAYPDIWKFAFESLPPGLRAKFVSYEADVKAKAEAAAEAARKNAIEAKKKTSQRHLGVDKEAAALLVAAPAGTRPPVRAASARAKNSMAHESADPEPNAKRTLDAALGTAAKKSKPKKPRKDENKPPAPTPTNKSKAQLEKELKTAEKIQYDLQKKYEALKREIVTLKNLLGEHGIEIPGQFDGAAAEGAAEGGAASESDVAGGAGSGSDD